LKKIIAYLDEAIKETRRISANQRPCPLDDLGLLPTISRLCSEFEQVHAPIQIEQRLDVSEKEISETAKVIIYRVLQESMNNVAKHSGANLVRIRLKKTTITLNSVLPITAAGLIPKQDQHNRQHSPDTGFPACGTVRCLVAGI
jgi:signal transduction histidine kinase